MKSIHTVPDSFLKNNKPFVAVWLRRDLRISDNHALFLALSKHTHVLPIFIFDNNILNDLDRDDKRVQYIHEHLTSLNQELRNYNSSILVLKGDPIDIFKTLPCTAVYTNTDYEPYARNRDKKIENVLKERKINFTECKDHVIFEKGEILKKDGTPYTIFTPYSKQWKMKLEAEGVTEYESTSDLKNLYPTEEIKIPSLQAMGFEISNNSFPSLEIDLKKIKDYHKNRNYPAIKGTTKLSVALRFGTISTRRLVLVAKKENETWLNELIWRDFYHMILWHFPEVDQSFKRKYDRIIWTNNEDDFQKWCDGKTGYPIVDAGMRELNATGFMHNRVRMITASFLTKHLLIDWRWGEAYFAKKLLDFDLAANNGGWQWASGSGCDAAPYFRVFNPSLQEEKFDPKREYINKWVPEIGTPHYPQPIVDHSYARKRALETYKKALL